MGCVLTNKPNLHVQGCLHRRAAAHAAARRVLLRCGSLSQAPHHSSHTSSVRQPPQVCLSQGSSGGCTAGQGVSSTVSRAGRCTNTGHLQAEAQAAARALLGPGPMALAAVRMSSAALDCYQAVHTVCLRTFDRPCRVRLCYSPFRDRKSQDPPGILTPRPLPCASQAKIIPRACAPALNSHKQHHETCT